MKSTWNLPRTAPALLGLALLFTQAPLARAGTITTYAGGGAVFPGDGGLATAAKLFSPLGVAVDSAGNVFFGDWDLTVVRRVDAATGIITTIAGNGVAGDAGDGGLATAAQLGSPVGIAVNAAGDLYIADSVNGRIRKVTMATGIITTVAGNGGFGFSGDGGPATAATLNTPEGVAVDGSGNIYIADTANHRVRMVNTSGTISTLSSAFTSPRRLAVDGAGNVYVLDLGATTLVRRISGGTVTTVAGGGASDGTSGTALSANLGPDAADVAVDANGNLFIAGALRVWKVVLSTGAISSIAGTGVAGFSGDGGDATLAQFNTLAGIGLSAGGDAYVSDLGNALVRKIAGPPPSPTFDGTISLTTSQSTLDALTTFTGSLQLVNVPGFTSLSLPALGSISVDFTISGNPDLTLISTPVLSTVGGSVTVANNSSLDSVSMASLDSVGGSITLANNTAAGSVDMANLTSAGGSITVSNNTAAGTVTMTNLDTVNGDVIVVDNPSASVTVGSTTGTTTVTGDLTVETTGSTVNYSTTTASGNVDVTGVGTTTLSANTGGLDTSVTLLNAEATMQAYLPAGSTSGQVGFSITHLNPGNLPLEQGVSFTSTAVNVDPVAAYSFNFAIPTLNSDATLVFDVYVAGLDAASQTAFLTALASGSATLAVKNDAAGSQYQTFPICSGTTVLTAGGCVSVELFDANGNPTTGTPAIVRFTGVVGHFSTYAVVIVTPVVPPTDSLPPTSSAVVTPTPNGLGWNKANVSVALSATDNPGGSGVASITYSATGAQPIASTTVSGASAAIPITKEGTTTITYRARDFAGNLEAAKTVTVKLDKTPPLLGAVALPALLTPADHRLVNIKVTVGVWDGLSGANGYTLVSVKSSEADSGLGGGDVAKDIQGWTTGTADVQGQLRAERSPTGPGRLYTLAYRAQDKAGNTATFPALVAVPK